jgi:uncharacterized protein
VVRKGLAAIEHYLVVRYFMYLQVYNHSKNIAASWMLKHIIHRARKQLSLGQLEADNTLAAWLTTVNHDLTLKQYLSADDGVLMYHIQRWCESGDGILEDLCRRYRDRNLLKAKNISHLAESAQQLCHQKAIHLLQKNGWDADYYTGRQSSTTRGYTLYQSGIQVLTERGICEVSDLSPLVQTLSQPSLRAWLIYPREIEQELFSETTHLS